MARFLSFLSLLLVLASSSAWVARIDAGRARRSYGRVTPLYEQVESSHVKGLDNHEEEGTLMATSIVAWLDAEVRWQECRGPSELVVFATCSCSDLVC
jgi:hypothetical protein